VDYRGVITACAGTRIRWGSCSILQPNFCHLYMLAQGLTYQIVRQRLPRYTNYLRLRLLVSFRRCKCLCPWVSQHRGPLFWNNSRTHGRVFDGSPTRALAAATLQTRTWQPFKPCRLPSTNRQPGTSRNRNSISCVHYITPPQPPSMGSSGIEPNLKAT
jgi:hypothetical protein